MPSSFEDYIAGGRIGLPVVKRQRYFYLQILNTLKKNGSCFYNAGDPGSLVDNATAARIARDVQNRYGLILEATISTITFLKAENFSQNWTGN